MTDGEKEWGPRQPLELSQWNLLPDIQLTARACLVARFIWIALNAGWLIYRSAEAQWYFMAVVAALLPLQYILDRLRGRPAFVGRGRIDKETPFQVRLLFDLFMPGMLLLFAVLIIARA